MTDSAATIREETARAVREAGAIVVLTGSGISAESGIPTFRGEDGLWNGFRAEELASPEGFRRHPEKVWEWYRWRLGIVRGAEPNAAHRAVAALERRKAVTVVTQNVDGLHHRAGSRRVLELHGSILRTRCSRQECARGDGEMPTAGTGLPACPCGALLRPAVVWFGEMLPVGVLDEAVTEIRRADLVLVVGTSSLVMPAASLPMVALDHGATVIEVNPAPTPLSDRVDDSLRGPAGRVMPALVRAAFDPPAEPGA